MIALSILTFTLFSLCQAQGSYAYGQHSDLKGLKTIYVDTGLDTISRNSIIKELEKSKIVFEIVDEPESAEILLGFGAGEVMDRAVATTSGDTTIIQGSRSRTGVGVVIAHARGKDRIVHSFSSVQESGGGLLGAALRKRPVTNFVREFVKIYKKANDLK